MRKMELPTLLVRNEYQEVEHGCFFSVVHLAHPMLASGTAGRGALSHRVATDPAVSDPGYCCTRSVCPAGGTFVPADPHSARPACYLGSAGLQRGGNLGVRRSEVG